MDRREEIYNTTLQLFIERGYDNTPMSLIAKRLGLSKASLYHYFKNKEHLLYKIHEWIVNRDLLPILEKADKISEPEDRLTFFLLNHTKLVTKNAAMRVLIHETRRLNSRHYKVITQVWRRIFSLVRGCLMELENAGKTKAMNNSIAAFALIGMCAWAVYWFDYSRKGGEEELVKTFHEVFFRGVLKGKD
jgi:AcrR family transcriptional regulator